MATDGNDEDETDASGADGAGCPGPLPGIRRMGRPTREEAERLNARLLDTAERLFLARGFEAVSIDQFADEARASKRTIYARYPSKEALFQAVIERSIDRILDGSDGPLRAATARERIEELCSMFVERALRPEVLALMRVVIAEAPRFADLAHTLDRRARTRTVGIVAGALRAEVARGTLALRRPAEVAAEQLMNLTFVGLVMRALMGGKLDELRAEAPEVVRAAVELFLASAGTGRA